MTGRKYCNENGISPIIMIQKDNGTFVQLHVLLNQFARANEPKRDKWSEIKKADTSLCSTCVDKPKICITCEK